jgi:hypothetical protein
MHITLQNAVIAAFIALALAATPALARPVDRADRHDSPTSSLAGTTQPWQDLRGEQAQEAARAAEQPTPHVVTEGPTAMAKAIPWVAKPIPPAADDDAPAPEIGGAIVGGLILAAGAAVATRRRRVATA